MKHIYTFMVTACLMLLLGTQAQAQKTTTNYGLIIGDIAMQHINSRMEVDFTIFIDGVKIRSNRSLRITPYITNGDELLQLPAVIIDGRRRHIVHERSKSDMAASADTYIRRYNHKEQIIDYQTDVMFEPWMSRCELILREEWTSCHDMPLAEATIPVAMLNEQATKSADALMATKQTQKAYIMPQNTAATDIATIDILFPVNRSTISDRYMDNSTQISALGNALINNKIKAIHLTGYASPEGPYPFNTNLAKKRAEAVKKHISESNISPDIEIIAQDAPIDWSELKLWLESSNLTNKSDIIAIINSEEINPADKNNVIKQKYAADYDFMLKNWYPKLRKTAIDIDPNTLTMAEAKEQLKSNPKNLSLEDMYMVANSLQKGSKEWENVIKTAVEFYPQSVEARINAANVAMDHGNYQQAEKFLNGIPANNPQAMNSRGIIAMSQGKLQEAMQLFQNAEKAGVSEATYNISLLKELMAADK